MNFFVSFLTLHEGCPETVLTPVNNAEKDRGRGREVGVTYSKRQGLYKKGKARVENVHVIGDGPHEECGEWCGVI